MLFPLVLLSLIFQTESIANTNTPVLVNLHHPNFTISLCQGLSFLIIVISSFTRISISGKRACLIIELLFEYFLLMKMVKFCHFMDDQLASTEYKKQQANFLIMHCIGKGRQLPLRALGRCPQITDHNKQNKCKNIPEGSYDPGTLPPLAKGVCCFEIDLENEVMVINQVIQTIRFQN